MANNDIYLDFAAATPISEAVMSAMRPYFSDNFYNPLAEYGPAREVRNAVDTARKSVASRLGCKPTEVVFTAGGSEANNLAINGIMKKNPQSNLIITAIEHDSVTKAAEQFKHHVVGVDKTGILNLDNLRNKIVDDTVLVSVVYANNEIGTIQPVKKIAKLLQEIREMRAEKNNLTPLYFHIDASQASNYLDLHVHRLGVDMMTLNGGKMYGPKQSGALYVRGGLELEPIIYGGGQERGLRSGTQNPATIVGFAVALDEAQELKDVEVDRLLTLRDGLIKNIQSISPKIFINGSLRNRLPNNISITIPDYDNERLQIELDNRGIFVAVGSACSASSSDPSRVMKAIGLSDAEARNTLRITLGRSNTKKQIETVTKTLQSLVS